MKRFFNKKLVIILFVLFICFIGLLELLSKLPCADIYKNYENPCFDLLYKNVYEATGNLPLAFPVRKKVSFSDINTSEFLDGMAQNTIFRPMKEVKANGRVCGSLAFVSEELPHLSKRYVIIHENIHLEGEYNETRTNYLAARLEPVGFVETVFYSLWLSFKNLKFTKLPCQMGGLWNVFKLYFLNS